VIEKLRFFLEFIGAFIGAALVFGIYYDGINRFDGGIRQVKK
jgi:glycerol uptake facilitator-like aquaporin